MRISLAFVFCLVSLSGCASYLTPRPPVVEDKVGLWGREPVGTLATAADYRVVFVQLDGKTKVCADPSPDAAAQFSSTLAAALSSPLGGAKEISANTQVSIAVAMKQLFRRSQGVQLYRDGAFAWCNLFLNGVIDSQAYIAELQELRKSAVNLIDKEIPHLDKIPIDPIQTPVAPPPGGTR